MIPVLKPVVRIVAFGKLCWKQDTKLDLGVAKQGLGAQRGWHC